MFFEVGVAVEPQPIDIPRQKTTMPSAIKLFIVFPFQKMCRNRRLVLYPLYVGPKIPSRRSNLERRTKCWRRRRLLNRSQTAWVDGVESSRCRDRFLVDDVQALIPKSHVGGIARRDHRNGRGSGYEIAQRF